MKTPTFTGTATNTLKIKIYSFLLLSYHRHKNCRAQRPFLRNTSSSHLSSSYTYTNFLL